MPIVIPAFEPDDNLLALCKDLTKRGFDNIIIIDDGSGQEYQAYFERAEKEYSCIVLKHAVNLGKGRALKNAFNYILNNNSLAIGCVTADSDGQHTSDDILKCMEILQENENSLVLGCRTFDGEDVPLKSRFGNELTRKVFHFLCGVDLSDTQTGLRGIPKEFMKKLLNVSGERFDFETNMLIECKDDVLIREVPIQTVYDSKENHKTHFDPIKDSIRIYKIFGVILFRYIFLELSASLIDIILFVVLCPIIQEVNGEFYIITTTIVARTLSMSYNFVLNYKRVFKDRKKIFIVPAIIQMWASALLVAIGVNYIKIMPPVIIKVIVDIILWVISYYVLKYKHFWK